MQKKKTTEARKPLPLYLSDAERRAFTKQAAAWARHPESMAGTMRLNLLMHWQILDHYAQHPPPGRSGPALALQAHRAYLELSEVLDEMLEKKRKKGGG